MKTKSQRCKAAWIVLIAGLFLSAWPASVKAQSTGRIDFTARVAPTGGRPEPVRQLTFYVLSKSIDDIRAEALQLEPPPDLDKFVDGLTVSPEFKTWMKKHRSVQLMGGEFSKSLTADDIMNIPELYKAYMSRNAAFKGVGFPDPKFKEKDREANPEKYNQQKKEYADAIHKFIIAVPESVEGIDADMMEMNPFSKWQQLVNAHQQRLDARTIELAQQRYQSGQTDTDLEGRGEFSSLAPGTYWIGMMGIQAISGDVRLRWDVPVTVLPGQTTRVELNNLNAERPNNVAQNSNH
jgi:hypothetical protein